MNKRLLFISIFFLLSVCGYAQQQESDPKYLNPDLPIPERVSDLMSRMTLTEKIAQMNQYGGISRRRPEVRKEILGLVKKGLVGSFLGVRTYREANTLQRTADSSRLRIPLLIAIDAIHGHGQYKGKNATTVFPNQMNMASTWNPSLVKQIAAITAKEMRATGYHWNFSPYVAVTRDPRWGRVGENFGEDPFLVSKMAVAMVKGYQGDDISDPEKVLANVKVFAAEGHPINGRNFAPADVSERTLREIYYPPLKAGIEAGARTVMAAHHELNGIPTHASKALLTDLLRDEWGFDGFVISDFSDIERLATLHKVARDQKDAVKQAVSAGVDVHMQGGNFVEPLVELVKEGNIPEARIDRAVSSILTAKFELGLFENRYIDSLQLRKTLTNPEHRKVALQAARESIILLKNDGDVLPLKKETNIFITGPNADSHTAPLGDWVEAKPKDHTTTVLEGIRKVAAEKAKIDYLDVGGIFDISDSDIQAAVSRARKADAAVLVVGGNNFRYNNPNKTGGENFDRTSIDLEGKQKELVMAVSAIGVPTIVVLINGRPLGIPEVIEKVPSVIEAWEPGMEGGRAIAEVLYGDYNPAGKLTVSFPRSVGHIPYWYNHKPSFTYRNYKLTNSKPLFEFGHGLSYSNFRYQNLQVSEQIERGENLTVSVEVTNTSSRQGDEVVQVYLRDLVSSVTTPVKKLVAFKRISLQPQETKHVELTISANQMGLYDRKMNFVIEPGTFEVMVEDFRKQFMVK